MSQITRDELKEIELTVPEYIWVEDEEAANLSPIKRPMAKIQKAYDVFTPYQAYQIIGKLEGMIAKRDEENDADRNRIELFKAELAIIESQLGLKDLEKQYTNECLAEAAATELKKNEGAPSKE